MSDRPAVVILADIGDQRQRAVANGLAATLADEMDFVVLEVGAAPPAPRAAAVVLDLRPAPATALEVVHGPRLHQGRDNLAPVAVDAALFGWGGARAGALRVGWSGDLAQLDVAAAAVLVQALGAEFMLLTPPPAATPAQLAQFYQQLDVLLVLSPAEPGAQSAAEVLACGVLPLYLAPAAVPAWLAATPGLALAAADGAQLRTLLLACAELVALVRSAAPRNAQLAAQCYHWPALRATWRALLRAAAGSDLLLLDDLFPQQISGFRISEYNSYLRHFPGATVLTTAASFPLVGERRDYPAVLAEYTARYPDLAGRVQYYAGGALPPARLAYMLFINNADDFLAPLAAAGIPFVFCLYPGGGFVLDGEESDRKLRRVFASPLFRQVICTQPVTRDYLLAKGMVDAARITLIGGVVVPQLPAVPPPKRRYGQEKQVFNVCFVANRYMAGGLDKGYDLFIDTARRLAATYADMQFHVVGSFTADELEVTDLAGRLTFHGTLNTAQFPAFYAEMELILSPNRPFVLSPGSFDGFPTGSCVEAALNGVAMFVADPLRLNPFVDGEELVIVELDASRIAEQIATYYCQPERLYQLARQGEQRLRSYFSSTAQMGPRIALLSALMQEHGAV